MHPRRFIFTAIAIAVLSLSFLTACGGSQDATGTIGGEITIGTGTDATPVGEGEDAATEATTEEAAAEDTEAAAGEGDAAAGEGIFASAGCAGCHALAAAGANGKVGPNLDDAKPDYASVLAIVTNGRGAMPAYKDQLSEDEIKNVSAYVAQNAGK
jgi:mono/diheme cytochrome c family protein